MKIDHLIFLIHPCCYESFEAKGPEFVKSNNYALYIDRERETKAQWLNALDTVDDSTLLLQLYGPESLFGTIIDKLGEAGACYVKAEWPDDGLMREYYRRLTECIRGHMRSFDLEMDPATVTSEAWGESFEGCVPGYAGAFAEYLGLKLPPRMRFEMTVYDSRFLYGAKRWESITLPGTDIEAWLFELYDWSVAAIFQARLSAQWLDERPIALDLNSRRVQVCNKQGHTVWPEHPWKKGDPEELCRYQLTTADSYWIRSAQMSYDDFCGMIASAKLSIEAQAVQGGAK